MADTEKLEERIREIESELKEIHEKYLVESANLRRLGIERGSRGVGAAFGLFALVFLVNVIFAAFNDASQIFPPEYLIVLGVLLCLALVAYFGFIFKFTVGAKVTKDSAQFGTGQ